MEIRTPYSRLHSVSLFLSVSILRYDAYSLYYSDRYMPGIMLLNGVSGETNDASIESALRSVIM